jgi:integrase/recombinase XerD
MQIKTLIPVYIDHLRSCGRAAHTIKGIRSSLKNFVRFLEAENLADLEELTGQALEEYRSELSFCLTAKGTPLARSTQIQILCNVKGFTAFLKAKDYLFQDPAESLTVLSQPQRLPKAILNAKEIARLMAAPDMRTARGYRNRIILEILYDTGIRRAELSDIKLAGLDLAGGYIRINGKGDKDRVVPVSARVCELIQNYLLFVRPAMVQGEDSGHLVVNRWGERLDPNGVWAVVHRCVKLAGIKKRVSTHSLRHSCATHMLKNGAPVRHIQEMLGHASINTTQIYTRVTINDLKQIHARFHPSETLSKGGS